MVMRQVVRMAVIGGAIGLVVAVAVGRLAQSMLFELQGPRSAGADRLDRRAGAGRARRGIHPGAAGVEDRSDECAEV